MTVQRVDPPTPLEVARDCRLIIAFALSGSLMSGPAIYIADEATDDQHYWIVENIHHTRVLPVRFTMLHEALRHALSNSGWGDYAITPPEGVSW